MLRQIKIESLLQTLSIATLFLFIVGLFSVYQLLSDMDNNLAHGQIDTQAIMLLKDARFNTVQVQQFLTDMGVTHDHRVKVDAERHMQLALQQLQQLTILLPEMENQVEMLRRAIKELYKTGLEMAEVYIEKGTSAGNIIMQRQGSGLDDRSLTVARQLEELASDLQSGFKEANHNIQEVVSLMISAAIWIGIFGIVILGSFLLVIRFKIVLPLRDLNSSLKSMAANGKDLTLMLDSQGDDELAEIARNFNYFMQKLRGLLQKILLSSSQLRDSGERMSNTTEQTLSGMGQLTEESGQLSNAINELNTALISVADNTSTAASSAQQTESAANHGLEIVTDNQQRIANLAAKVNQVSQSIMQLEEDSNAIGTILDVISNIADQTNLLALNAAIEAARAGEQGRGFAVVADEVRTLAGRTQSATLEIQEMIEKLQRSAKIAAEEMSEGQRMAETGQKRAGMVGESLQEIVSEVSQMSQMNMQIASSTEQQSAMVTQVSRSIDNVSNISQKTLSVAHSSVEMVSEVVRLGNELDNLINEFKLD